MPFTFSHPAAAVPFSRWGLPLSALVVGSLSPDFTYFITQSTTAKFGHTLPGVLFFCIPVGLVVLWTFHTIIKYPLLDLLPEKLRHSFASVVQPLEFTSYKRFGLIVLALLIGALTHVMWDGFTGSNRFGTQMLPVLNATVLNVLGDDIQGYQLFHFISSVVGALLLLIWSIRGLLKTTPSPTVHSIISPAAKISVWIIIIGITAATFWCAGNVGTNSLFGRHWEVRGFLQDGLIATVPIFYALLLLYGCAWYVYRRQRMSTVHKEIRG